MSWALVLVGGGASRIFSRSARVRAGSATVRILRSPPKAVPRAARSNTGPLNVQNASSQVSPGGGPYQCGSRGRTTTSEPAVSGSVPSGPR